MFRSCEPAAIYLAAKEDGVDRIARIRLLRELFGMSLTEAKETIVAAEGTAPSLTDHQDRLLPALNLVLTNWDNDALLERFQEDPLSQSASVKRVSGL